MPDVLGSVLIELTVGSLVPLRLFASENGTVMFHGAASDSLTKGPTDLHEQPTIGRSDPPLYFALRDELDPHLEAYRGQHTLELEGQRCALS